MRVAILCNTKSSERPNRPELIELFINNGCKVFFGAIDDGKENEYFNKENAYCLKIKATRDNTNPIKELMSLFDIKKCIKREKIDYSIVYGIKNHAAMGIGSVLGKAKLICVVNGRGNLFTVKGTKGLLLRLISFPMLKIAYALSQTVCFQNPDDADFFVKKHLVARKKIVLMNGSGVNLREFPVSALPEENRFLYLARITPSKGLVEFIKAAERVKEVVEDAQFDVVGPVDELIEGSCKKTIDDAVKRNIVRYHGKTDDVQYWLRYCRYFIYPSYYPEGVPRCVLQAMSTGRPVITTNTSGCKETVINGMNGYLVEPKNIDQLSSKMILLTKEPEKVKIMAQYSRIFAEEKFDVEKVNRQMIDLII